MRPELEKYYQIDQYLKGELQSNELIAFELKIKEDAAFAEEVTLQKATNEVVKGAAFADLRAQMSSDIKAIDIKKKITLRNRIIASSIGITVLLATSYFLMTQKHQEKKITLPEQKSILQSNIEKQLSTTNNTERVIERKVPKYTKTFKDKKDAKEPLTIANEVDSQNLNIEVDFKKIETKESKEETIQANIPPSVEHTILADPCKEVNISATPLIQPACTGEANGKVVYNIDEIRGGSYPYQISFNNQKNKTAFYHLNPGEHSFIIKDKNGCQETLTVVIPEKNCSSNKFILHPDLGEIVKIPASSNKPFTVSIYNKRGELMFKSQTSSSVQLEWQGTDQHGATLESGVYLYVVEFNDGTKENGQITVLR